MSVPEFTPVGQKVEVSKQLTLDYSVQRDLVSAISYTANQIEASPFAIPAYREVHLGRIATKNDSGRKTPDGYLSLQFSEDSTGLSNAIIGARQGSTDTFRFRQSASTNDWESIVHSNDRAHSVISNEEFVKRLDDLLYKKDAMKPLLDTAHFPSVEIPRLLIDQFAPTAPSRRIFTAFDASSSRTSSVEPPIGLEYLVLPEYTIATFARLCILKSNRGLGYSASIQTPIAIGDRIVNKKYSYELQQNTRGTVLSAVGKVSLASTDGYSHHQLKNFAQLDRGSEREPEILENAMLAVLRAHSIPESSAV